MLATSQTATLFRKSRRISITVSEKVYTALSSKSDAEGRSLSNLAAFLLEKAILEAERKTTSHHASQGATRDGASRQ